MRKYKFFCLLAVAILPAGFTTAQRPQKPNTVNQVTIPADHTQIGDAYKMISDLQTTVVQLQQQVMILKTETNLHYQAHEIAINQLQKSNNAMQTQLRSVTISAFVVTAAAANLADAFTPPVNTGSGTYYTAVIIDNAACNNNPNAILIVVPQIGGFGLPVPVAIRYDNSISKWKIIINPHDTNSMIVGQAKASQGANTVSVLSYSPYQIRVGDKFNVEVIK